jgi:predicted enzyme related to lactoylglutathione lyase
MECHVEAGALEQGVPYAVVDVGFVQPAAARDAEDRRADVPRGIRRIMFAVDELEVVVARMCAQGAEVIGGMQYEDAYRLAYIRGPEGIIVALAEQLG